MSPVARFTEVPTTVTTSFERGKADLALGRFDVRKWTPSTDIRTLQQATRSQPLLMHSIDLIQWPAGGDMQRREFFGIVDGAAVA